MQQGAAQWGAQTHPLMPPATVNPFPGQFPPPPGGAPNGMPAGAAQGNGMNQWPGAGRGRGRGKRCFTCGQTGHTEGMS